MAMVFKSDRNLEFKKENETSNMGPGRYFPNINKIKIEKNKQPFLTGASREKKIESDTPGPGAYYQDETRIKYLRNIHNEKIQIQNDNINLITQAGDSLNSADKKGFNIKSKRFKIKKNINTSPGPGQYFVEQKHNIKEKLDKMKESELYSKQKIKFIKSNEYQRIPTIPSKEFRYGFDLLKNGNLIKRKNPDLYKTFTGEKNDSVGPGSYEIEKPNDWLKTGTSWSKLKTVRDYFKTNSSCMTTTYNSESKRSNIIDNSSIKIGSDDGTVNIQISQHSDSQNLNNTVNYFYNKNNKKDIFNCRINNCKNANNKKTYMEKNFENVIKNYVPGPGYYFDEKQISSFNIKPIPEYQQFFGSKTKRFEKLSNSIENNNKLGPGTYFKNNKKSTKSSSSIFVPFSTATERFNEKIKYNPGPGDYETSINEIKKSMSNSVDQKFGSTTMRFDDVLESKWKQSVPGPGYYNPKNKEIIIDKNFEKKEFKNFGKGNLYNMTKKDSENIKANVENLKNYEIEKKRKPPIGLYNPDIIFNIDYNNKKKIFENNNVKTAFSSTVIKTKRKNLSVYCPDSNLGPGYYFKDKKIKKMQIFPPFHQSDKRKDWVSSYNQKIGPGTYTGDSFNDWNKKSFNINYV